MLFRPTIDQNIDTIHTMLDIWNGEADRFRRAAIAVRKGETPDSLVVSGAEEAHDELISLLDQIDAALSKAATGSPRFAELLQAQATAVALFESVSNSWDLLDTLATETMTAPTRIPRESVATAGAAS